MTRVGIVGAAGFVGSALCKAAEKHGYKVFQITRANFNEHKATEYDFLINTAMPSKRFWAFNNPVEDVNETVVKTASLLYEWKYNKFIQVSSISAKIQLDIPYGSHKRSAEVLVENRPDTLIVRLGALYGEGLRKGALYDLVNHKHIYVDIDSEYNYLDVNFAANWIIENLDKIGIKELGACDTISLREISQGIWASPSYSGRLEKLYSDNTERDMPTSRKVLDYVDLIREN